MHAAMKKARGGFARAFIAVLANNEFVEDSVTRSQGFSCSRADKPALPVNNRRKTGRAAHAALRSGRATPEQIVRTRSRNSGAFRALFSRPRGGLPMKSIVTIVAAGLLAGAFVVSADAAAKKSGAAQLQAHCQAQAKKKYSAIHFLKRRDYVKNCMHQRA
jgi:hypothetical protein